MSEFVNMTWQNQNSYLSNAILLEHIWKRERNNDDNKLNYMIYVYLQKLILISIFMYNKLSSTFHFI